MSQPAEDCVPGVLRDAVERHELALSGRHALQGSGHRGHVAASAGGCDPDHVQRHSDAIRVLANSDHPEELSVGSGSFSRCPAPSPGLAAPSACLVAIFAAAQPPPRSPASAPRPLEVPWLRRSSGTTCRLDPAAVLSVLWSGRDPGRDGRRIGARRAAARSTGRCRRRLNGFGLWAAFSPSAWRRRSPSTGRAGLGLRWVPAGSYLLEIWGPCGPWRVDAALLAPHTSTPARSWSTGASRWTWSSCSWRPSCRSSTHCSCSPAATWPPRPERSQPAGASGSWRA